MESFWERLGVIVVSVVLASLVTLLLAPFLPIVVVILIGFGIMAVAYYFTMQDLLSPDIPSSYEQQGSAQQKYVAVGRLLGVFILGVFMYGFLQLFLTPIQSVVIAIVSLSSFVILVDRYFSSDLEEELRMEKEHQRLYVNALGRNEGQCQSCMEPMSPEDRFCSNCGFERKKIGGDRDYVG